MLPTYGKTGFEASLWRSQNLTFVQRGAKDPLRDKAKSQEAL